MPSATPIWMRCISFSIRPEMSFAERAKSCITNAAAIAMTVAGSLFAFINAIQDRSMLVPFNVILAFSGAVALFLAWKGWHRSSFIVANAGASAVFILVGLMFRNGVENFLLISLVAAFFVFDSRRSRWCGAVVYGSAFLWVRLSHFEFYEHAGVSRSLYAVNGVIFLAGLCFFMELFRRLTADAQGQMEEKKQELDREHEILKIRTEELREANRTKEKLFSVVAHDLRGPVASLRQSLEMLDSGLLQPEEFKSFLPQLRVEAGNVHECLESLLAWAQGLLKATAPEITNVPLAPEFQTTRRLLHPAAILKNIVIDCECPESAIVRADADRLRIVLRNMVSNAIKYTPVGGRVFLKAHRQGGAWSILISDNGMGMTPERVREILTGRVNHSEVGTRSETGTGLGLQICRELLLQQGATLNISSKPGEGTTLVFLLPAGEG